MKIAIYIPQRVDEVWVIHMAAPGGSQRREPDKYTTKPLETTRRNYFPVVDFVHILHAQK